MKIAIQQPYYLPYAGYFRLFATTDMFVIYDCVQWNRTGRVHRSEEIKGRWNTLHIKRTDRYNTRIMDLQWQAGKEKELPPVEYIIESMKQTCEKLGLPFNVIRSSSLNISPDLHGVYRILEICKRLGAKQYINSPGGRHLYEESWPNKSGVQLKFLPGYQGSHIGIGRRLERERPEDIRNEIIDACGNISVNKKIKKSKPLNYGQIMKDIFK